MVPYVEAKVETSHGEAVHDKDDVELSILEKGRENIWLEWEEEDFVVAIIVGKLFRKLGVESSED